MMLLVLVLTTATETLRQAVNSTKQIMQIPKKILPANNEATSYGITGTPKPAQVKNPCYLTSSIKRKKGHTKGQESSLGG